MATAVEDDSEERLLRVTDVAKESCKSKILRSIGGYENMPLVSLEDAVEPLVSLLPAVRHYANTAKQRCKKPPADGLTVDESASVMLYSMSWHPIDTCLYFALNAALRSEDKKGLVPWFSYLKLFLTALYRLPSLHRNVFRGVKLDLSEQYQTVEPVVWWGFSSCTVTLDVLKSKLFLGKTGARTIFTIQCDSGKDIQNHSYYPSENEILLFAATQFKVKGSLNLENGLHMIQLEETKPPFPLLQPVSVLSPQVPMSIPTIQPPEIDRYRNLALEKKIREWKRSSPLNLEKQQLIDKDMNIVVDQAIIDKQCKQLWLNYNKITSVGASILSQALINNNTLEELELQGNQISDEGVSFFANIITVNNNTVLKKLVVGNNGITDKGVGYLAQMLRSNRTLTFLGLSGNRIMHQGVQSLVDAILMYNTTLRSLILTENELTDASGSSLLRLIQQSQSLTFLDVNRCHLTLSVKNQINQAGLARTGLRVET